MTKGIKVSFII